MKFQIPKQLKPDQERVHVKLERSVREQLDRYCQYIDSERDYVVGAALSAVFHKDKGFAEWLKVQQASSSDNSPSERRAVTP